MPERIAAEFSRPITLDALGDGQFEKAVEAGPAERASLARRFGIPAVTQLCCRFRLTPGPAGSFEAAGFLDAIVVQTCVVTLEDFEASVAEAFSVRFVPEG